MKSTSLLALATALSLIAPLAANAQSTSVQGTVNSTVDGVVGADSDNAAADAAAGADAAADASATAEGDDDEASASASGSLTLDANADGTVSTEEIDAANAALAAMGNTSITIDANADGTISAEEIAAVDAALSAGAEVVAEGEVSIDTNGDGLISPEEAAAAGITTVACSSSGIEATIMGMGAFDAAAVAAATDAKIVLISDCNASDVSSALASASATNVRDSLAANAAVVAAIQARGATLADVLGATTSGGSVTVYVSSDAVIG